MHHCSGPRKGPAWGFRPRIPQNRPQYWWMLQLCYHRVFFGRKASDQALFFPRFYPKAHSTTPSKLYLAIVSLSNPLRPPKIMDFCKTLAFKTARPQEGLPIGGGCSKFDTGATIWIFNVQCSATGPVTIYLTPRRHHKALSLIDKLHLHDNNNNGGNAKALLVSRSPEHRRHGWAY